MRIKNRIFAILMCSAMGLSMSACSTVESPDRVYPITLGSAEIIVGKTQVGALYDIGCQVAITVGGSIAGTTNWATSVLSQDMTLGKKTTYENFYIMKDGIKQASVNITTKKAVSLKEAVIGELEIDTSVQPTEDITFDGIALSDLTQEKFLQKVADSVTEQDKAAAGYSGKKYSVSATWNEDGSIATLQMKKNKR